MAQQTAVEWLEKELEDWLDTRIYLPPSFFEQAKAIEKEQVIDAYVDGQSSIQNFGVYKYGEDYYNNKYDTRDAQ